MDVLKPCRSGEPTAHLTVFDCAFNIISGARGLPLLYIVDHSLSKGLTYYFPSAKAIRVSSALWKRNVCQGQPPRQTAHPDCRVWPSRDQSRHGRLLKNAVRDISSYEHKTRRLLPRRVTPYLPPSLSLPSRYRPLNYIL
jgi:hypothetical protein